VAHLFEHLLREAIGKGVDLPVIATINNVGTISGEIDSSQPLSESGSPFYARVLNASLVDLQQAGMEPALVVPKPPSSSAVQLPGGPNRRWMVTIGALILTGEEVEWDQWLDYNSITNGGEWHPSVVMAIKSLYPIHFDTQRFFHLINVQFHNTQIGANLGGPVLVPVSDVICCGNRWRCAS
jgi:hypothetical protein